MPTDETQPTMHQQPARARQFTRWPFPREVVDVYLTGHVVRSMRAVCANLSASGLGLFTSTYVAPGTGVIVSLPHALGGTETVRGEVVRCTVRREQQYDVGVRLLALIDPLDYVRIDPFANIFVYEDVDAGVITGVVGVLSASRLDRELWSRALRASRATPVISADITHLERVASKLDVLTLELGEDAACPAGEAVLRLVKHGFSGRVVLIAPDASDKTRSEVSKLPSHAVLLRPYDAETLLRACAQAIRLPESRDAA